MGFADILLPPHADDTVDSLGVLRENTDIENVLTRRWAMGVSRAHTRESGAVTYETLVLLRLESEARRFADNSEPEQINDVATATYTWTRKAVDKITDPTRGHLLTLSGTIGLRRDLQDNFLRLYGRYLYYLPVSPRDQVILRGEAGNNWVDDPNKVPNEYLFRTGGVGSVRGYSYQSLGVRQGTATIGSRSLLVGSAEYVRWLNPAWGGAAFCESAMPPTICAMSGWRAAAASAPAGRRRPGRSRLTWPMASGTSSGACTSSSRSRIERCDIHAEAQAPNEHQPRRAARWRRVLLWTAALVVALLAAVVGLVSTTTGLQTLVALANGSRPSASRLCVRRAH